MLSEPGNSIVKGDIHGANGIELSERRRGLFLALQWALAVWISVILIVRGLLLQGVLVPGGSMMWLVGVLGLTWIPAHLCLLVTGLLFIRLLVRTRSIRTLDALTVLLNLGNLYLVGQGIVWVVHRLR